MTQQCIDLPQAILAGKTALGIELGSTRIKAVLIDENHQVIANGAYNWENSLKNGLWTYSLEEAIAGLQQSFAGVAQEVQEKYGVELTTVGAIGISGMMHGYLPLDASGAQLADFLTWRNTNTGEAAGVLTELFQFNIPLRWSSAHLYQAILENREHVGKIAYLTTLAGYIHYRLTGLKVMGLGEASGMFPIDSDTQDYDTSALEKFDALIADKGYGWKIKEILPKVLPAGANAGQLTSEGAALLDPTGKLQPGIIMAPPEGDAGTGMVATNSVAACTGNVSAGTSIFTMIVLEKKLSKLYRDIDMVMTPCGKNVAMVHCNNGASELDAWMRMFGEILSVMGADASALYEKLFKLSLEGDKDAGGLLLYNYIAGEHITGVAEGRPLLVRKGDTPLTLANFMRSQLYSILASTAYGMRILEAEQVRINRLTGHGGLFKTPGVAQRYMAAAMHTPITVMTTAGEGGPYGMALLAAYMLHKGDETLAEYLENKVFSAAEGTTLAPDAEDEAGYAAFLAAYCDGLALERAAVEQIH